MEAKWGRPSGDVCQQNPLSRMSPGLMKVGKALASHVYRVSLSHSMSLTPAPGQAWAPTAWDTAAQGEKRRPVHQLRRQTGRGSRLAHQAFTCQSSGGW